MIIRTGSVRVQFILAAAKGTHMPDFKVSLDIFYWRSQGLRAID